MLSLDARRPPAARRAAVARRPRRRRDGRRDAGAPRRRRPVGRAVPVGARAAADGARRTPASSPRSPYTLRVDGAARDAVPRRRARRAGRRCRRGRGSTTCRPRTASRTGRSRCCTSTRSPRRSCRSASTGTRPSSAAFCGIELTRGEQTIPVKTPAQLAEVCTAARDLDHAVDVTLTTGSLNRRDRGAIYISRCAARDQGGLRAARSRSSSSRPTTCACSTRSTAPASTRSASTPRRSTPRCSRAWRRARRSAASRATSGCWERAVEVFGRGSVTTYVLLGMGERPRADRRGLPARDRDGRLPVRRAAAPGAGHADGRRAAAGPRLRRADLPRGVGDARRRRPRPRRREGRLRALPGVLGAVGVGARLRARGRCRMSTISSSALATSATSLPRSPRGAARARRALRRAPRACSSSSRGCSTAATATSATTTRGHPARRRPRRRRGRRRGAAVPARRRGLWKGDRLAVLPEARVRHARRAARALRRRAPPASSAGTRMVAQVQLPNVRFFERLGWERDGPPAPYRRRHAPADGDPAARASPVSGVAARSHTVRLAPPAASRSAASRRSSPHGAHARPRRANGRARGVGVLGARREQEAEARERQQPALESARRRAAGARRGRASRRSRRPRASAAASRRRRASRRRARRGRAPPRRPRRAPRRPSRSRSGGAVVQRGEERLRRRSCTGRRARTRRAATSPGCGRRRPQRPPARRRCRTPTAPAAWPSVRWPPTTGTPSSSAAQAIPSSTRSACARVRADQHVDERQRPAAHRAHVGDVRDHRRRRRRRTGRPRRNGGEIASPQRTRYSSPCGDERGVVAVDAGGRGARRARGRACRAGRAPPGPPRPASPSRPSRAIEPAQGRRERAELTCCSGSRPSTSGSSTFADALRDAGRAGGRGRLAPAGRRRPARRVALLTRLWGAHGERDRRGQRATRSRAIEGACSRAR